MSKLCVRKTVADRLDSNGDVCLGEETPQDQLRLTCILSTMDDGKSNFTQDSQWIFTQRGITGLNSGSDRPVGLTHTVGCI